MKNRLLEKIREVKKAQSKLFCAFLTIGYPNLKITENLLNECEKEGVDIVELGFPFSDPLADGPTIQFSSERALEKGIRLKDALQLVRRLRQKGNQVPIIFFTYLNPILQYGFRRFIRDAKESGFDGLLVPDLPPEEEKGLQKECHRQGFPQVYLMAPTTEKKRAASIARSSQGFIYYVSLRGVTGARRSLPSDVRRHLREFDGLSQHFLIYLAKEQSGSYVAICGLLLNQWLDSEQDRILNSFYRDSVKAIEGGAMQYLLNRGVIFKPPD